VDCDLSSPLCRRYGDIRQRRPWILPPPFPECHKGSRLCDIVRSFIRRRCRETLVGVAWCPCRRITLLRIEQVHSTPIHVGNLLLPVASIRGKPLRSKFFTCIVRCCCPTRGAVRQEAMQQEAQSFLSMEQESGVSTSNTAMKIKRRWWWWRRYRA